MRPLLLQMTAFGPFSEQEQIDFTRLGDNPLFLINGPTGSGKTTILDAICFALYGKTTGDEREGGQMRCDLAAAELLTEVILEFELHGRVYRIRRLPEQQRPKSRGEGFTEQKPEAQLVELQADGSEKLLVSSKVTDATKEIENLTGLSVDQFRQVMVLPQGKFRQLLMAESAEREKIFGQLFQTRIYKRLEESLKAQSAEIRRERERQLQLQEGILEGAEIASQEALEAELETLRPEVNDAEEKKLAQEQIFLQAGKVQQQAEGLVADFQRLESTAQQLTELKQQQTQVEQNRDRLALAEQALKLQPNFFERQRCAKELQHSQNAEMAAQKQLQEAEKQAVLAEDQFNNAEKLLVEIDQCKARQLELVGYRERAVKLTLAQQQQKTAQQQLQAAEAQKQGCAKQFDQTTIQRENCEQQQQMLQQRQLALAEQQMRHQQLAEQLEIQKELERLKQLQRQLGQQLQLAEEKGKQQREVAEQQQLQAKQLELAWHQGQAAILAADLQSGQACPVCGSCEHPAPAHSDQTLPTQQHLEQARERLQSANHALAEAREAYAALREQRGHCDEQIEKLLLRLADQAETPVEQIAQEYRQLTAEIEALLVESQQLKRTSAELEQLKQQETKARQKLEQSNTTVAVQTAELAKADNALQTAEQELPAEFRQSGALEQALAVDEAKISQLETKIASARQQHKQASGQWEAAKAGLSSAGEAVRKAGQQLAAAEKLAVEALVGSSFSDECSFQEAQLEDREMEQLKIDLAAYDNNFQRLSGAYEQQKTALQGKELPDLSVSQNELELAEQNKRSSETHWQQLAGRLKVIQTTHRKLQQAAKEQSTLEEQYAIIGTLSDVANGQTGHKISLQRFVLSVLLDDVLLEASQRLQLMSKGRYQLLRKEDRSKGNKASGLDLVVEDAYTGKLRPVATLSGGESFLAALALALGLSDVVQAYAGGIRLDTLFIDEGFGSLDAESLDLAVRTLVDLQAAGRMVGVISHVAELKEQLPLRIDLLVDRQGSRTQLVIP